MRISALLLVLLLAQIGWKGDQKYPLPPQVVEARVDSLAGEYYKAKLEFYPADATLRGIPGYDGNLSTYSQRSIFGLLGRIRNLGRTLTTFDEDSLSMAKWAEYKALMADMAAQTYLLDVLEVWRTRPTLYVDACAEGIVSLYLLRDRVTDPDLSPRLRKIPHVVRHARRNLTRPSELHCRVASRRLQGLIGFLSGLQVKTPSSTDPELILESLAALQGFATFIDSLASAADPAFALGYDDFMILMDKRSMISDTPEGIRTIATGILKAANLELEQYSAGLSTGVGKPAEITSDTLETLMRSAWEFISREDLVGLPRGTWGSGPGIKFVEMPDFARPFFGDVLYAEPWREAEPGYLTPLFVSPETAYPGLTPGGLVASEAIPGRHMQALSALLSESPIAGMHRDIFTVNGWALYCREMMARAGFGGDDAVRAALERKRFHAAGTIAAISLFLGEFTLGQAADFMVEETGVSEGQAHDLAIQYALEPEQPMSYIIGERQIRRIRDEVRGVKGEGFSLRAFHDSLLACGRLPLYLMRNKVISGSVGR